MGRFSSVQTYADTSNRVAPEPYDKATGGRGGAGGGAGEEVRAPVVVNVKGSGAGVGSSWYHGYRWEKRREEERLMAMQKQSSDMVAEQELRERMASHASEADMRTAKRAAERRRRKEKERARRGGGGKRARVETEDGGEDADGGSDEGEGEGDGEDKPHDGEEEYEEEAGSRGGAASSRPRKHVLEVAITAGAGSAVPIPTDESLLVNDGKFMERFRMLTSAATTSTTAVAGTEAAPLPAPPGPEEPASAAST